MNTINCQCLSCLCVHIAHSWCLTNLWRVQNFKPKVNTHWSALFLYILKSHTSTHLVEQFECIFHISTNILETRSNANQQNVQHDKVLLYQIYVHICARNVFFNAVFFFVSKLGLTWCWLPSENATNVNESINEPNECMNLRANK